MKFLESVEELVYKCRIRNDENGEHESLPKTAEWISRHKALPRIGDTVIPLEHGPVNKPFYVVHSVIWDTNKNEIIILLERQLNKLKS
jgi:hypothetical protein